MRVAKEIFRTDPLLVSTIGIPYFLFEVCELPHAETIHKRAVDNTLKLVYGRVGIIPDSVLNMLKAPDGKQ